MKAKVFKMPNKLELFDIYTKYKPLIVTKAPAYMEAEDFASDILIEYLNLEGKELKANPITCLYNVINWYKSANAKHFTKKGRMEAKFVYIDAPIEGEDGENAFDIPYEDIYDVDLNHLDRFVSTLDDVELLVYETLLRRRTTKSVGDELGVSGERVRQRKVILIRKLRNYFKALDVKSLGSVSEICKSTMVDNTRQL